MDPVLPRRPAPRRERADRQQEKARDQLREREGDVAKGVPISARIGRLRFEAAAADLLTDYQINAKRSYKNLKTTVVEGALEPWFRGRRMAGITTADPDVLEALEDGLCRSWLSWPHPA